jgi:PAS domain S-box-containing protein
VESTRAGQLGRIDRGRGDGWQCSVSHRIRALGSRDMNITEQARNGVASPRVGEAITLLDRLRLLASGEKAAQLGSWEWSPIPDRRLWSDNLFRIFGLYPNEIEPSREFVLERTHPDDRERVATYIAMAVRRADPPPIEFRIEQPDGSFRHVRSSVATVEPGASETGRIVGTVQDVTERRRAEREVEVHLAVGDVLLGWDRLQHGAELLLRSVAQAMDLDAGVFWLPRGDVLVPEVFWNSDTLDFAALRSTTKPLGVGADDHLPVRVWEHLEPASWVAGSDAEPPPRDRAAIRAGLRSSVAFPAVGAEEILAVIELFSREEIELTQRLTRSLTGIGHELGWFLDGHRGELEPKLLTPREIEVLQLAANGSSGRQIASELVLSPATVKTHFENIFIRLRVSDRTAAVAVAMRKGFIA